MAETKSTTLVSWDGLQYYDSKIKAYVDEKIEKTELADKELERRLDAVEKSSALNTDNISDVRKDIDEVVRLGVAHEKRLDDLATEVAKITTSDVPKKVSELENDAGYITSADLPSLENYYTKEQTIAAIETAIEGIEIPEVDLTGYATEQFVADKIADIEIPSIEGLATEDWVKSELAKIDPTIPSEYVTETELEEKGYITTSALEGYAKTEDIPSTEGLATEEFVADAISKIPPTDLSNYYTKAQTDSAINEAVGSIKIPEVDLTPYATKEQLDASLLNKADTVLFTTDFRVKNPVGNFVNGESVQNMTIADLFTKLLGLVEYQPPEGILDGTPEAAFSIIENEIPSYMLSNSGELVVNEYERRVMSIEDAAKDNQDESFFYQIKSDDGVTAIETGYHIATEFLDQGYLTVLIPEHVENMEVKVYDSTTSDWVAPQWSLIKNDEYTLDGYIAYTADPAYQIYDALAIRVVIK